MCSAPRSDHPRRTKERNGGRGGGRQSQLVGTSLLFLSSEFLSMGANYFGDVDSALPPFAARAELLFPPFYRFCSLIVESKGSVLSDSPQPARGRTGSETAVVDVYSLVSFFHRPQRDSLSGFSLSGFREMLGGEISLAPPAYIYGLNFGMKEERQTCLLACIHRLLPLLLARL